MNFVFSARLLAYARLASALCACAFLLTGCSDSPHEHSDATPPASMPPASLPTPSVANMKTKSVPAKPAAPVPAPTDAELGMPVYPHAKTYTDAAGKPVPPLTDGGMATATLETSDTVDQVVAFYKDKITETNARGEAKPVQPREEPQDGKRKVVLIGNDAQHNVQMAEIREGDGKTIIELIHAQAKSLPSGVPGATGSSSVPDTASRPGSSTPSSAAPSSSPSLPSGDTRGPRGDGSGSGMMPGATSGGMLRPPSRTP